jgi:predicted CoA-binding protein
MRSRPPPDTADVAQTLRRARTVAVLGASSRRSRAAFYVPAYMAAQGYRILSVRPGATGQLHGGPVLSAISEISEPVDVLNVFRRAEHLSGHLPEILALAPTVVWLPTGIVAPSEFAAALAEAGIGLIQDRCMMVEHRLL